MYGKSYALILKQLGLATFWAILSLTHLVTLDGREFDLGCCWAKLQQLSHGSMVVEN
jgi:hypothetical protein